MSLDTRIRRAARRTIHAVGTTVTIRRKTIGAYSPASGTVSSSAEDFDVTGRLDDYMDRELSNTIHAGDRKLTLAASDLSFVPAVHDLIVIDDVPHDVVRVTREMAQHEPAMYVLQLRA